MKNNEKIEIKDILSLGFTKVEKVVTISLQLSENDMNKLLDFNKQNDYEYTIKYTENNLVDSKNIFMLSKNGYDLYLDDNCNTMVFKHWKLKAKEEEEYKNRYK